MKKYLIIDLIVMVFMAVMILFGEGDFLAVNVFILSFGLAIILIICMNISNKIQRRIRRIEDLIDSGEYKVYLDGQLIEDPQGLDIAMYSISINHKKKVIRLTTNRQTNIFINRY